MYKAIMNGVEKVAICDSADSTTHILWLFYREDISICRTSENKKCRLGEGGFGVVYKALMNGVDEVAVKLVKADKPTNKELLLFHKEVQMYC